MHVQALLWKQWLLKRRNWISTLVEICSPVLVMATLVTLSDNMKKEKAIYHERM